MVPVILYLLSRKPTDNLFRLIHIQAQELLLEYTLILHTQCSHVVTFKLFTSIFHYLHATTVYIESWIILKVKGNAVLIYSRARFDGDRMSEGSNVKCKT